MTFMALAALADDDAIQRCLSELNVIEQVRNVARTTLANVFGQLSQRVTDLRVVSEPDVEPNIFAGAVRSFRLAYTLR